MDITRTLHNHRSQTNPRSVRKRHYMYSKTCVKRPLKKARKLILKTNCCLMQVRSIAECSKGSILKYFRPSFSYHLSLTSLSSLFLSSRFTQFFSVQHKRIKIHILMQDYNLSKQIFSILSEVGARALLNFGGKAFRPSSLGQFNAVNERERHSKWIKEHIRYYSIKL